MPTITYRTARAIAQTMLDSIRAEFDEQLSLLTPKNKIVYMETLISQVIESLKVHFTVSN